MSSVFLESGAAPIFTQNIIHEAVVDRADATDDEAMCLADEPAIW
jgi:hypothetical protein